MRASIITLTITLTLTLLSNPAHSYPPPPPPLLSYPDVWSYMYAPGWGAGPDLWYTVAPACGGSQQSPIDFSSATAVYSPELQSVAINYQNYTNVTLKNGVKDVSFASPHLYEFRHPQTNESYKLMDSHFHWGGSTNGSRRGSEHQIDGRNGAAELHMIHIRSDLDNVTQALDVPSGVVVLTFIYHLDNSAQNPELDNFVSYFWRIITEKTSTEIPTVDLNQLIFGTNISIIDRFFLYNGSLTVPPCHEGVTFLIADYQSKITSSQLDAFNSLSFPFLGQTWSISPNIRPPQNRNNRTVLKSFPQPPLLPSFHRRYEASKNAY